MAKSKHYKKKVRSKYIWRRAMVAVLTIAIVIGVVFAVKSCGGVKLSSKKNDDNSSANSSGDKTNSFISDLPTNPKEPYIVASATTGSSGDIMCHQTQLDYAKQSDGTYYFKDYFEYVKKYFEKNDLMIANLEVPFGGTEAGAYRGYPGFNTPDSMADAVKYAGIDTVLLANNHLYDTGYAGMLRTMRVLKEKEISFIGARESQSNTFWQIKDVNGIKIGVINYTYSTKTDSGNKALNGNVLNNEAGPLVNTFTYNNLTAFYDDAKSAINEMKKAGAEVTFIYIHWGDEYKRSPNSYQTKMAQQICDIGYDVIVGSHPHVIEPFAVLKGKEGNETLCVYSTGNLVSNQRTYEMTGLCETGHTEDGMIFSVKFDKYSDGKVVVSDVNIQPLWVDLNNASGKNIYRIVPLDPKVSDWKTLGAANVNKAKSSYNRTMKIVGKALNAYRAQKGWSQVPLTVE